MAEGIFRCVFLGLALIVWPTIYVTFCIKLARFESRPWSEHTAYFILFGVLGGWMLALALSPSGLAASCLVFLVTIAPLACLAAAIGLLCSSARTRLGNLAMTGCFLYGGIFALCFTAAILLHH